MKRSPGTRRRPVVQITLNRAARLHRLVTILGEGPRARDFLLANLRIGLRTFYRELDLLRRCGVKVRLEKKQYRLHGTVAQAEGRLPFPDPQLSFAEMAELASGESEASKRLNQLLESVLGAANNRDGAVTPASNRGSAAANRRRKRP